MRTFPSIFLASFVAAALACGGFDNDPFRTSTVIGRVTGNLDTSRAQVFVLGSPELQTTFASDGSFELNDVPVGTRELILFGGSGGARREQVEALGGALVDLGTLELQTSGAVSVEVKAGYGLRVTGGTATLLGTPFVNVPLDAQNRASFGHLPPGAYAVRVDLPGLGTHERTGVQVTSGFAAHVEFEFEHGDPSVFDCNVTGGCLEGLLCQTDGLCTPDSTRVCSACQEDTECGAFGACNSIGGGQKGCFFACGANNSCSAGYTCEPAAEPGELSVCIPDTGCP